MDEGIETGHRKSRRVWANRLLLGAEGAQKINDHQVPASR
jgi:hypothetical protein